jgi:hypothetical protein
VSTFNKTLGLARARKDYVRGMNERKSRLGGKQRAKMIVSFWLVAIPMLESGELTNPS